MWFNSSCYTYAFHQEMYAGSRVRTNEDVLRELRRNLRIIEEHQKAISMARQNMKYLEELEVAEGERSASINCPKHAKSHLNKTPSTGSFINEVSSYPYSA